MPRLLTRLAALLTLALLGLLLLSLRPGTVQPIRVGVVHALSGVMADNERGLVDAVRLAVEELNAAGGLLGRPLELVIADSASDNAQAAAEAERLIRSEGVSVLFGCWTSACRKALKPVVEQHRHLLFYALQYEGMEQSPHIVYLGAAPNQQIIPGARWAMDRFGPRVFLVGSDYVFPRTANQLIRDLVRAGNGEVVAARYAALSATDFGDIVAEIRQRAPDVILNTINGSGNRHFFAALADAGLQDLPVVSFSIAEPELAVLAHAPPHHHAVWGYFQSLPQENNRAFVARYQARFGHDRPISDPIATTYAGVRLWAMAVRDAGTDDPTQINLTIGRMSSDGPLGIAALDTATRHLWRRVYVGQARADGQFDAHEISEAPVRPAPFPPYRSKEAWLQTVAELTRPAPGERP